MGDAGVTLLEAVCGDRIGTMTFNINSTNPTISTVSADFIRAADSAPNWEGEVWDKTIKVPCTTLDALIAEHGLPAFTKIDVEGFENAVLAGLSRPLVALSFEFTTIQRNVAMKCLDRLTLLAPYRFDVALGLGAIDEIVERLVRAFLAGEDEIIAGVDQHFDDRLAG